MKEFDFVLDEDFKEDSVREFVIAPLLRQLGFILKSDKKPNALEMTLSKTSKTQIQIGSNKTINTDLTPDYTLFVEGKTHCILDAKAPNIKIHKDSKAEKQAKSYLLAYPSPFYALCNARSFMLFETNGQSLLVEFSCEELFANGFKNEHFALLKQYLTTSLESLRQTLSRDSKKPKKSEEWYLNRELPKAILNPKKQNKARYFGCTAYFTRQSWDIVTQNIKNFTDEGDVVLDPFGGSGVTAIEAMMNGRIGIHTDLNPLSIFMAKALSAQCDLSALYELSEEILSEFESLRPKSDKEAKEMLKGAKYYPNALSEEFGAVTTQKMQDSTLWIPKDEVLPKGSDVDSVLQLFSKRQLAELALLRKLIFKHTTPSGDKERRIYKRNLRYALMLGFYNTLKCVNLTFHKSGGGGGDASAFRYYRYRLAPKPTFLDSIEVFRDKIKRIQKGKKELESAPSDIFYQSYFYPVQGVIKDFKGAMMTQREDLDKTDSLLDKTNGEKIFQADATNLKEIESKSVDFIYTDPPYGAKIPYLDLSTMWNVWLDLSVDSSLKERECIEKGSLEKSSEDYHELMKKSLKEMYRVLKWNRWLAFVFQHQDPQLWQILVEEAEKIGFEYVASVRQGNGQTSFKKRQYTFTVLSGQLILYFKKVDTPKARIKENLGDDAVALALNHAEALIARDNGATLEEIHGEITIKGFELGFYHELAKQCVDLTLLINANFELDKESGKYHLPKGTKFKSLIPLSLRTKYFLLSYLRGAERQGKKVYFDDICLEVIPLLKNGVSPSNELIREVLDQIAIADKDTGQWRLKDKKGTQGSFDL